MYENEDILQSIPDEDIPKLRDIYKEYFPRTVYAYNFLHSALKWRNKCPNEDYVKVMAPHGNWKNGTVVAVNKNNGYEVFISTLEKNYEILNEVITKTKNVDWNKRMLVYAIHDDLYPTVLKALQKTNFTHLRDIPCQVWWMPWEEALQLEINHGPEVYIKKVDKSHAEIINNHWPHRFKGSEHQINFLIEMNGGLGVFLNGSDKLVAWVLRIQIGLGMLHVLEEHTRRGYGALVAKALSKEMAEEKINPLATVVINNTAALATFKKIGFKNSETIIFIENKEEQTGENGSFAEKASSDHFNSLGI